VSRASLGRGGSDRVNLAVWGREEGGEGAGRPIALSDIKGSMDVESVCPCVARTAGEMNAGMLAGAGVDVRGESRECERIGNALEGFCGVASVKSADLAGGAGEWRRE